MEKIYINNTRTFREFAGIKQYKDYSLHKELISFVVSIDALTRNDYEYCRFADYINEIVVVVEKEWLFNLMNTEGISEPQDFLMNEYTDEDSCDWYFAALYEDKIAVIEFN